MKIIDDSQVAAPTVEAVVRPWERYKWIMAYIKAHGGVDVLNSNFVDDYAVATGAKISAVYWGANHCPMLGRDLAHMAKCGALERGRIGLGYNWQPGFPKWVWVYTQGRASYLYESNTLFQSHRSTCQRRKNGTRRSITPTYSRFGLGIT